MTLVETNFPLFVLIGVSLFTLLGVVVLLTFWLFFRRLERQQEEADREMRLRPETNEAMHGVE